MTEIIAQRQFAPLYIWLDIAFLCVFLILLLMKKKYMTVLVGLVMGAVHMLVDYGIFHLVCHSRSISDGYSLVWVLLWMSMSYGFTNFTWILAIGVLVQFGWEAGLLLGGIRSTGLASVGAKLHTLVVNSRLETNLGMPYVYCIYAAYSVRFTERLRRRPDRLTFTASIAENNARRVRG